MYYVYVTGDTRYLLYSSFQHHNSRINSICEFVVVV